MTHPSTHLPGLDHLRALAILLVFFCHYAGLFPHPAWLDGAPAIGWTGVDLFFVLSGYLIAGGLFSELQRSGTVRLGRFYARRSLRILPAFFVVLAVYFLFPAVHEREGLAPFWKYATFTQNLGLDLRTQGTFSHAWSLCIEEQFYLLLPAVLLAARPYPRAVWLLPALLLAGLALRGWLWHTQLAGRTGADYLIDWHRSIYYPTWARLDGLLVGIALAAAARYRPAAFARWTRRPLPLLLAASGLFAAAAWTGRAPEGLALTLWAFPLVDIAYGLVLAAVIGSAGLRSRRWIVTERLAAWSFALYLVHKMTIHGSQRLATHWGWEPESNGVLLLSIGTTLLAAAALRALVERPALWLRGRLLPERERRVSLTPDRTPVHPKMFPREVRNERESTHR
ncbi:acyltransferase [Flaviaesturariibacter amylovorans]|uniref:Acyltransferase n=1 Tax=Flaviaesturariibacter amylovorans TaxID=1084520 RepID=A0ABP8G7K7_9BACT